MNETFRGVLFYLVSEGFNLALVLSFPESHSNYHQMGGSSHACILPIYTWGRSDPRLSRSVTANMEPSWVEFLWPDRL